MSQDLYESMEKELYEEVKGFADIVVDNDTEIDWEYGNGYTFELKESDIVFHNEVMAIFQKLDVISVNEELEKKNLGSTLYCKYVNGGNYYNHVKEFMESKHYNKQSLDNMLRVVMEKRIDDFDNGEAIKGCLFYKREGKIYLNEDDILDEFKEQFGYKFSKFYMDIMTEGTFEEGEYIIEIPILEVTYTNDTDGWEVLITVKSVNTETGDVNETDLVYKTGVRALKKSPDIQKFRRIANYIVESFKTQYQSWEGFGIYLTFDLEHEDKAVKLNEKSLYHKVIGEKEDTEIWYGRFKDMVEENDEVIQAGVTKLKVKDGIGIDMTFVGDLELILGVGGIMTLEGQEVYIKKEMNLQQGLRNLVHILGKNELTVSILRTYDYRRKVKEDKNE